MRLDRAKLGTTQDANVKQQHVVASVKLIRDETNRRIRRMKRTSYARCQLRGWFWDQIKDLERRLRWSDSLIMDWERSEWSLPPKRIVPFDQWATGETELDRVIRDLCSWFLRVHG